MKAMILAAGRGERMKPLTDHLPKPLLPVAGQPLIVHHIKRLAECGITELVINISYRAEQITAALGDGRQFGVTIQYSYEETALETAGGIIQALPLLGEQPFLVVNGDIWTDYPFQLLQLPAAKLAQIVLVDNPEHNPQGDFYFADQQLALQGRQRLTFSGIGLYHPRLFKVYPPGKRRLAPVLLEAIEVQQASAEYYRSTWLDIGTVARLEQLEQQLNQAAA